MNEPNRAVIPRVATRTTLVVLSLMNVLAFLNEAFVTTSAMKMVSEFKDFGHLTWIFTAYAVTMTVSLPMLGRMADMVGIRPISLLGAGCFTLGSLLCSISWSLPSLVVFRGIQGLGAAALMSMSMVAVGALFPRERHARIQGQLLAISNAALAVGPVIGGLISDRASWRWCFYVSVALGAALLVAGRRVFPTTPASGRRVRLDYAGSFLFVATTLPLLFALSAVGDKGGVRGRAAVLFAVAAVALFALVAVERRVTNPLLPVALLARREIMLLLLLVFISATSAYIVAVYYPVFTQVIGGATATKSGLLLLPFQIALIATNLCTGALASRMRFGRQLALGFAAIAGSFGAFAMFATTGGRWLTSASLILAGAGLGIAMPLFMVGVHRSVHKDQLGAGTTSVSLFRRLGSSLGIAILGAMLVVSFQREMTSKLPGTTIETLTDLAVLQDPNALIKGKTNQLLSTRLDAVEIDRVLAVSRSSMSTAIRTLFGATGLLAFLAMVLALALDERKLHPPPSGPRGEASS